MEEQGLWALFWATGLPEAWLSARLQAEAEECGDVPCTAAPEEPDPV